MSAPETNSPDQNSAGSNGPESGAVESAASGPAAGASETETPLELPPTPPHEPQVQAPPASAPAPLPEVPAAVAPAVPAAASPHRLSTFLKVSIILLAALSISAIALVFVGDFEGKVERITATFLIFAVFVGLTAADTSRGQRNGWYAPVALIANSYILALLLIVTWMSDGGYFLAWEIFWKAILVIGVTRAVVGCCQLLLGMGEGKPEPLGRFAFITSVLAVVSGILFTAPLAIEVFDVEVPELYWKFAVAALLLTALGLAITLLLRWSYSSADRDARRRQRETAAQEAARQALAAPVVPMAAPASQRPVQPQTQQAQPPQAQQPARPLLPWPTFPDGRPLPARPDGQPDFSALGR